LQLLDQAALVVVGISNIGPSEASTPRREIYLTRGALLTVRHNRD